MKALLIPLAAFEIFSFCSSEKTPVSFGTDFSKLLAESDIKPYTDDYIIQSYPQTVNIFFNGNVIEELKADYICVESYNKKGEAVQNGFGYLFKNREDAIEYFEYVTRGVYEADLINQHTVWFNQKTNGQYKQDIIKMLNQGIFDPEITFISIPTLTKEQETFILPEHKTNQCKG